eukprot:gene1619-989_t
MPRNYQVSMEPLPISEVRALATPNTRGPIDDSFVMHRRIPNTRGPRQLQEARGVSHPARSQPSRWSQPSRSAPPQPPQHEARIHASNPLAPQHNTNQPTATTDSTINPVLANATPGIPLDNLASPLLLKVVQRQLYQQRLLERNTYNIVGNRSMQRPLVRREDSRHRHRHRHRHPTNETASLDATTAQSTTSAAFSESGAEGSGSERGARSWPPAHPSVASANTSDTSFSERHHNRPRLNLTDLNPPDLSPLPSHQTGPYSLPLPPLNIEAMNGAGAEMPGSPGSPDGFYANPTNTYSYIDRLQFQLPLAYGVNEETGSLRAVQALDSSISSTSSTVLAASLVYGSPHMYEKGTDCDDDRRRSRHVHMINDEAGDDKVHCGSPLMQALRQQKRQSSLYQADQGGYGPNPLSPRLGGEGGPRPGSLSLSSSAVLMQQGGSVYAPLTTPKQLLSPRLVTAEATAVSPSGGSALSPSGVYSVLPSSPQLSPPIDGSRPSPSSTVSHPLAATASSANANPPRGIGTFRRHHNGGLLPGGGGSTSAVTSASSLSGRHEDGSKRSPIIHPPGLVAVAPSHQGMPEVVLRHEDDSYPTNTSSNSGQLQDSYNPSGTTPNESNHIPHGTPAVPRSVVYHHNHQHPANPTSQSYTHTHDAPPPRSTSTPAMPGATPLQPSPSTEQEDAMTIQTCRNKSFNRESETNRPTNSYPAATSSSSPNLHGAFARQQRMQGCPTRNSFPLPFNSPSGAGVVNVAGVWVSCPADSATPLPPSQVLYQLSSWSSSPMVMHNSHYIGGTSPSPLSSRDEVDAIMDDTASFSSRSHSSHGSLTQPNLSARGRRHQQLHTLDELLGSA